MKWFLVLLVAAVVLGAGGFWWWSQEILPPQPGNEEKLAVVVAPNQTGNEIVGELASQGVVKSFLAAKIYLYVSGLQSKLQAGSFVLTRGQTLAEIIQTLTGPSVDVWVTIPEGWRREQIAIRLEKALTEVNISKFSVQDFMAGSQRLEGRLFPDTYLIPRTASASDVIRIMTANFAAKSQIDPVSQKDTLILASLVEREGKTDADRPIIAGILINRLEAGWPLQVDATVQYTLDNDRCRSTEIQLCKYWEPVTNSKFPSPYNTYLHAGLPPTPISNPGLASIRAALNPAITPYWYYLHAPDGSFHYARTLTEHNSNIDKYLRL